MLNAPFWLFSLRLRWGDFEVSDPCLNSPEELKFSRRWQTNKIESDWSNSPRHSFSRQFRSPSYYKWSSRLWNVLSLKKKECSWEAHRFKSVVSIKLFTWNTITVKGIEDKNTKNSIKSKNYHKSKRLENLPLIDWYIVIKPSVLCSGRKRTSEKMSVDSIQHQPPQLKLKLSLVRLTDHTIEFDKPTRCPIKNARRLIWYKLKMTVLVRSVFIFSESSNLNLSVYKAIQNWLKVRRGMATKS